MKKVLFGIMALSMAAFAVNSRTGNPETASVPVKVIAEIIKAPTGLTITDESGTVLDELLIDHGRIIAGQATSDSVAYKIFNVRRYSDTGEEAVLATAEDQKITVELDDNKTALKKDGTDDIKKLNSELRLGGGDTTTTTTGNINKLSYTKKLEYKSNAEGSLATGDKIHSGRVTSIISKEQLAAASLVTGVYHNSRERKLTVTIPAQ